MLHRSGIFDHFIVLTRDLFPIHDTRENGCQVRQTGALARRRQHQFLTGDRLEPRGQFEAEQMAKGETDCALAMGIDVLALDLHVRAVAQHALDHGCNFG